MPVNYTYLAFLGLIFLVLGSFIGMLAYRWPIALLRTWQKECQQFLSEQMMDELPFKKFSLLSPLRSFCPHCFQSIAWYYNIPILGFCLQMGRCRRCAAAIPKNYLWIEIISLCAGILLYLHYGFNLLFCMALLFTVGLLLQSFIDIAHRIIPDELTYSLLWIGLVCNAFHLFTDLKSAVFGAVIGYLILYTFAFLFKIFRKKDGMGHGDFKLFAMCGAWLGMQQLPFVLLFASLLGTLVAGGRIVLKKQDLNVHFAFGPYLALAAWVNLLYILPHYPDFSLFV